ncbi:MAG: efflux RND transporter periplasmic adaptor subunit [Planctomycetota bacterium]|nr:efflux RND transporter periplasmic adaptor subunit [Planctomycetota bacterium]
MGTATTPPTSSSDQPDASAAAIESTRPAGGSGPDPIQYARLQQCLTQVLSTQCLIAAGLGGAAFIGSGRSCGLAAQYTAPDAERVTQGAALLAPATLERMAQLAAALTSQGSPKGLADSVMLPRARAMYGDEIRLRAFAAPLLADGKVEGACVVLAKERPGVADDQVLAAIAAACSGFEAHLWREQCLSQTQQKLMLRETVELLDAAQQGQNAQAMGSIITQELKRRFGCTRVSLGLVHGHFIRVIAMSGVDEIDRTAAAIEPLEALMEECAAQDSEVIFPPPSNLEPMMRRVTRDHEHFSRAMGPAAILSLPLRVEGGIVGVVVLEREPTDPLPLAATALLRLVAETVGPAVWTRRMADRGVFAVMRDRAGDLARAIAGPRHTGLKLILLLCIITLVGGTIVPIPSRVSAPGGVKAAAARTIAPPFAGYLAKVNIRPGDHVAQGQVLAEMDTTDLRLQLAQAQAEFQTARTQRDEALSRGELAKVAQYDAESRKSQAMVDMLDEHIKRAIMVSPVDGLVGRGDLEQFVRARVDSSQPLFEIVTQANVTVAYVDERDIQRVHPGQTGRFVSKALPGEKLNVTVARITPVAEPHEGTNAYQVELTLADGQDQAILGALRPGMTGSVKLDDGWTTPITRVLRPVIDEARLRLWW